MLSRGVEDDWEKRADAVMEAAREGRMHERTGDCGKRGAHVSRNGCRYHGRKVGGSLAEPPKRDSPPRAAIQFPGAPGFCNTMNTEPVLIRPSVCISSQLSRGRSASPCAAFLHFQESLCPAWAIRILNSGLKKRRTRCWIPKTRYTYYYVHVFVVSFKAI